MTPSHIAILVHQRLEFGMECKKAMNQNDVTFSHVLSERKLGNMVRC